MIKAWVESDNSDFKGGEFVFAAVPPVGSTIAVRDANGGKFNLTVKSYEFYGIREEDWAAAKKIGASPDVIIYCGK